MTESQSRERIFNFCRITASSELNSNIWSFWTCWFRSFFPLSWWMLLDWRYKDVFWRFLKMQQTCRRFLGFFCSFFPSQKRTVLIMWRGISPALLLCQMLEIKRESKVTQRFRLLLRCSVLKLPSCTLIFVIFGGRSGAHHHHQTCLGGKLPEALRLTPEFHVEFSGRRQPDGLTKVVEA